MRLIYYKLVKDVIFDFNITIGGSGPLSINGFDLLSRKLQNTHSCSQDDIVICNIIDIKGKEDDA